MSNRADGGEREASVAEIRPSRLRSIEPHELVVRFIFGAAISVIAAVVGMAFSPVVGGMFLAFPAILPATLTLIEKKHDTAAAIDDDRGAILGSLALVAFALVAASTFLVWHPIVVLLAATAAWVLVSAAGYAIQTIATGPRRRASGSAPGAVPADTRNGGSDATGHAKQRLA
jgi:hypothetical protein